MMDGRRVALLLLVLCALSSCMAGWIPTVYTASLTGSQESPSVGSKTNIGVAVCVLARHLEPKTLDCEVAHSVDLSTVTSIAIHHGRRGSTEVNDALYTFTEIGSVQFRQVFELQDIVQIRVNANPAPGEPAFESITYTVSEQVDDFLNGEWHINIISTIFPVGEIRGQLEHAHRVFARLESDGVVNEDGSFSSAQGLAIAKYSPIFPRRELSWEMVHTVEEPVGVEVSRGPMLDVGHSVVSQWENIFSPVEEAYPISASMEQDMFADGHHLNILSTSSPNYGEIRSEIHPIDYIPKRDVSFTAKLMGRNEVPLVSSAARGCALFTLDCHTRLMEYFIVHTAPEPVSANVFQGEEGEIGSHVFSLNTADSPIYGSVVLDVDDFLNLVTEGLYVSVATRNYPGGEIRGQITAQRDWVAYLTGTSMPEPVTTSAVGCGTFQLIQEAGDIVLNYDVTHSVKRPMVMTLQRGEEFTEGTGKVITQWGRVNDRIPPTITGENLDVDDGDLQWWLFEKVFVRIDSEEYPEGEIRGQVFRINPCNAAPTPTSQELDHFLPPLIPPPPPPSPRDPFVIATVQIDNTTVEIVIGHVKGGIGAAPLLQPLSACLVALLATVVCVSSLWV